MHISNRQQFEKRALKIIAFVLLAVLLLEGMSKVLMPRSNSGSGGMHNYRARGFYGEEKNSLDIAAIGNSDGQWIFPDGIVEKSWYCGLCLWRTQSDH